VAALQRREKVQLVSPESAVNAAYRVREGEGGTWVRATPDGLTINTSAHCCLVELLPQVPAQRYRITATLRVDQPFNQNAECGVYWKHASLVTAPGPQHYCAMAYFSDAIFMRKQEQSAMYQAWLGLRWLGASTADEPQMYRFQVCHPDGNPTVSRIVSVGQDYRPPWRTLQIDVAPDVTTASCLEVPSGKKDNLGRLRPSDHDFYLPCLAEQHADLANLPSMEPGMTRYGLGVYVRAAQCTIRYFALEVVSGDEFADPM
jgi:hypothetical protein